MNKMRVVVVLALASLLALPAWAENVVVIDTLQSEVTNTKSKAISNEDKIKKLEGGLPAERAERIAEDANLQYQIDHIQLVPGPEGPQGDQGPEGPQGPPGGGVCMDNRVIVEENCIVGTPDDPMPSGDFRLEACAARCPAGTMLVGGGCFVASNALNKLGLIRNIPVTGPGNIAGLWQCGVINGSPFDIVDGGVSMEAKAICLVVNPECK